MIRNRGATGYANKAVNRAQPSTPFGLYNLRGIGRPEPREAIGWLYGPPGVGVSVVGVGSASPASIAPAVASTHQASSQRRWWSTAARM